MNIHEFQGSEKYCSICLGLKQDSCHNLSNLSAPLTAEEEKVMLQKKLESEARREALEKQKVEDFVFENGRIDDLQKLTGRPLEGRQEVEIRLNHSGFLNAERLRMEGEGKSDQEILDFFTNHIIDLKRKQQQFKIQEQCALESKTKKMQEMSIKLTPEEVEQYKRDSKKKEKSEESIRQSKREKMIQSMMKAGLTQEQAENILKSQGG